MKFKRQQLEDKMGLDMYLKGSKYLWSDGKESDELTMKFKNELPEGSRINTVSAQIGYWRKANQIHKWFVDNVQGGNDDCGNYEVVPEHIETLRDLVTQVLEDNSKAPNLLPTQGGFFFGETTYDQYYFEDLVYTKKLCEDILSNENICKGWSLEYHSSW